MRPPTDAASTEPHTCRFPWNRDVNKWLNETTPLPERAAQMQAFLGRGTKAAGRRVDFGVSRAVERAVLPRQWRRLLRHAHVGSASCGMPMSALSRTGGSC